MGSPTSQSTGLVPVTAGTLHTNGRQFVNGVLAMPGATVTLYDNNTGTATGNIVFQVVNAGTNSLDHILQCAVRCDIGLTIVVSGTTTGAIVYFGAA